MTETPKSKIRWQAAFTAFCNGTPEEEIAQIFQIPLNRLKVKILDEGWRTLRTKLPLATLPNREPVSTLPAEVSAKLEVIEDNRKANLAAFSKLRDHLLEVVTALKDGRLKLEKQFNFKGNIVRAEVNPGPSDWVNIATYAQTIAQGTYRALGDFQGQEKPGQDALAGQATMPQAPAITIILPGVIAAPRAERKEREGTVIDVRDAATRQLTEGGAPLDV